MKNFFQNIFKKTEAKQSVSFKKNTLTHPGRDWTIVVVIATILTVLAAIVSYGSFIYYYNLDKTVVDVAPKMPHYQGARILEQMEAFKNQEVLLEEMIVNAKIPSSETEQIASSSTDEVATSSVPIEGASRQF